MLSTGSSADTSYCQSFSYLGRVQIKLMIKDNRRPDAADVEEGYVNW